jgi:putative endonuclease
MTCYVYIVEGKDGHYYTGITSNIRRRMEQHNGVSWWPGARYTMSRRPVFLVHLEKYATRSLARSREIEIKSLSHTDKTVLISSATKSDILSAI